ncbi:MAG: hypothetical protein ACRD10_05170 [Terriglobia bacterium]
MALRDRSKGFALLLNLSAFTVAALFISAPAQAWGPEAHQLVADWAVQTLPDPLQAFFAANHAMLLAHADDPDEWMKKDPYERMRHYIFLDSYGRFPYLKLPHSYTQAVARYGKGRIGRTGTLPWQIGAFSLKLTDDFRAQKWNQAIADAAALGYYVADAHDPLNTTENYDGQLSGQAGLAVRFGVTLVGRYKNFMAFSPTGATNLSDPTEHAFQIVLEANTWVDRVLLSDAQALDHLPDYNEDYYDRFYTAVGTLVRSELGAAANDTGSYWYTAWRNAGEPGLRTH